MAELLLRYDVGDGTRVKFCKHMWCGDCTLKEAFPDLFCLSRARDSSVTEVLCWTGGRIHWNFQFHGAPQDWEEDSFDQFMAIVLLFESAGGWP